MGGMGVGSEEAMGLSGMGLGGPGGTGWGAAGGAEGLQQDGWGGYAQQGQGGGYAQGDPFGYGALPLPRPLLLSSLDQQSSTLTLDGSPAHADATLFGGLSPFLSAPGAADSAQQQPFATGSGL